MANIPLADEKKRRNKEICKLVEDGKSQTEVAKMYGITQGRVGNLYRLYKFKQALRQEGKLK